jgi:hypothetical protein
MRRFTDRPVPRILLAGVLTAGLAGLLAGALSGCRSQASDVALPQKPQLVRPAVTRPARRSARQLVVTAYEGYWAATSQALNSRSPVSARQILAGFVPRDAIPALVSGLRGLWKRNEIGYGHPVFHIMGVHLTGPGTAAVHDCIDLSHAGFQNRLTGQVVGGLGHSHDYLITTLARRHGRWLVTGAVPVVRTCTY